MKIVAAEIEPWERAAFERLSPPHEVAFTAGPLEPSPPLVDADVVSTFIYSRLGQGELDRFPRLRLVATRSTGVDHIDLAHCAARGIRVANVPSYGANTVAEHVFALLLTLSHRMEEAVGRTRRGEFSARGLQGFDLYGRVLGIVGTGQIGRCAIRIARGFGMDVLAYDVRPDEQAAATLGFRYTSFEDLLERADVVSLHVPATPATRHLLGQAQLERMKRGAIVINTARGDVIDTSALVRALAEGRVGGAGLDVLPEEPVIREEAELLRSVYERTHDLGSLLADHVLLRLRNVVVTPHSAFNTREAVQRILDTTVANIAAFAAGRPQNLVTAA